MRFLALLALAACGGHVTAADAGTEQDAAGPAACELTATKYGTSCNVDGDCAAVFLGNACASQCVCANGAISASDLSKYDTDSSRRPQVGGDRRATSEILTGAPSFTLITISRTIVGADT